MRKDPPFPANDEYVGFFHRHFVPIYLYIKGPLGEDHRIISAFVMSVYDEWFMVTAGHCIDRIHSEVNAGAEIIRCRLIDCMGTGASHAEPIPFEFNESSAVKICYDLNYDYGVILLDSNTVSLLKGNGVEPLAEKVWSSQPENPVSYKLMGVPEELVGYRDGYVNVTTIIHEIYPLPERPIDFEETDAPTLFARVKLDDSLSSIKGMSGGPIFAFQRKSNGELRYWLYAVQSRWIPSKKELAACLMQPLGNFIKEFMEGKHQDLIDEVK